MMSTHSEDDQKPSAWRIWTELLLYPGHTLPTAISPVFVGIGLAIHDHVFAPAAAVAGFVASWLIHIGGVFIDNYELIVRHPTNREHPELMAAVANGTLTLTSLRLAIFACFALAAACGPYLLQIGGWPVVLLGIVGIVASAAYAGGPYPYAKLGLADVIFFLMFGVVAVMGIYYIQLAAIRGSTIGLDALPLRTFVVGLPVGALVTNVLLIDDLRDREPDVQKGWRTGTVRFGRRWTRVEYVGLSLFAYVAPFWFWFAGCGTAWILLPLLTLPVAVAITLVIGTHDDLAHLRPMTARASLLALTYSLLLAIGLATNGI